MRQIFLTFVSRIFQINIYIFQVINFPGFVLFQNYVKPLGYVYISQNYNSPGCHIYHKSHVTIHHKMCRFKKHMKTFNRIHSTIIHIYHRRRAVQLFLWSTTTVDDPPLFYVLTARVFKCPKYGKMDTIHVNVNV